MSYPGQPDPYRQPYQPPAPQPYGTPTPPPPNRPGPGRGVPVPAVIAIAAGAMLLGGLIGLAAGAAGQNEEPLAGATSQAVAAESSAADRGREAAETEQPAESPSGRRQGRFGSLDQDGLTPANGLWRVAERWRR
jgi:hypothetical protein